MGYELKTNTAVRIPVGPLVDPGDGKTAETSLTVTDLSVQIYKIANDGGAVTRTQFAPTASGGDNDMALVASSTDGVYDLELTATQLNFLGNARICFYDLDGFLVHYIDILVVSANYFGWKYGTGNVNADAVAISGDTTAADNLESACDNYSATRGLAGTALPAAAANAAGGLPISTAGSLDLDAKLANTNEVTAARMGALTDWIDGNRLDLLLDSVNGIVDDIKTVTDALPNAGALTDLATAAAQTTAQNDLDLLTGADGATLATLQGNYAPSTHSAADVKTAIEAAGGHLALILADTGTTLDTYLQQVLNALVHKQIWTEADGALEMFDAANSSLGTIAAAVSSDGTYTTRKRMVI